MEAKEKKQQGTIGKFFLTRNVDGKSPVIIFINDAEMVTLLKDCFSGKNQNVLIFEKVPASLWAYFKKYHTLINIHLTPTYEKETPSETLSKLKFSLRKRGCIIHERNHKIMPNDRKFQVELSKLITADILAIMG